MSESSYSGSRQPLTGLPGAALPATPQPNLAQRARTSLFAVEHCCALPSPALRWHEDDRALAAHDQTFVCPECATRYVGR